MIALSAISGQHDCLALHLFLKKRVPLFLGIASRTARLADQVHMRRRFKVVTVIGAVLIAHPFRLGFPAFVVRRWIEKAAVAAAVQVRVALRAGIPFQDFLRRNQLHGVPALITGKGDVWHSCSLARCCWREARVH